MDRKAVTEKTPLIFDFDGTICGIFKNYDLKAVAAVLAVKLNELGLVFSAEQDVFDVFTEIPRQTAGNAELRKKALMMVNDIITAAEQEAVQSGITIPGALEVLPVLIQEGYPVGIVTNNSKECVERYLQQNLPEVSIPVIGRIWDAPEKMKPAPWLLQEMVHILHCEPEECVFIGDNPRDYECSCAAGCPFLGMAPNEKKKERFRKILSEHQIVGDFYDLKEMLEKG